MLMRSVFDVYLENRRSAEITQLNKLTILSFRSVERMDRARFFSSVLLDFKDAILYACFMRVDSHIYSRRPCACYAYIDRRVCTHVWIYGILSV